jgi:hypothetical protein
MVVKIPKRWQAAIATFACVHLKSKPGVYFTAMEILSAYTVKHNKHKDVLSSNRVAKVLNILVKKGVIEAKKKRGRCLYKSASVSW